MNWLKSFSILTILPEISEDNIWELVGVIFPVAETIFLILPFSILINS